MRWRRLGLSVLALISVMSLTGAKSPGPGGDEDSGGGDRNGPSTTTVVIHEPTFRPRVTALRSLNAYLATDKEQQVYYVPTLEDLPGVDDAVSDCIDYSGQRQQFAAVYKGYFNQMCYQALVRKNDGTYSKVPAIVSSEGKDSVRELTTLGYDFLLTRESISNIHTSGENISADYATNKVDSLNGYVDLNTALMDIYKAVGQDRYDITYAFTQDNNMTVENSPIQKEINLSLSEHNTLDTSAGKGWVFATRTNPVLYWKQAAYDGVVFDTEALNYIPPTVGTAEKADGNKSQEVTLAQFCAYAYNIMNIYGEPVMTQSEKSILLQLYGSVVPYKACGDAEVEAIETFIAKGIISPDDDQTYLNWNGKISYNYMLTLLMRIKDTNARKTYKDVKITMDVSMLNNDYYNARLTNTTSSVQGFESAMSAARVTNYYDYYLDVKDFKDMAKSIDTKKGIDLNFFIPTHIVIEGRDGTLFPLTTQVTPLTKKVYSIDYPDVGYVLNQSTYSVKNDGVLMQFCISNGVLNGKLHLRVAIFDVKDLVHDDGTYHLYLMDDTGKKSASTFTIQPGGGIYYKSGVRNDSAHEDDMITDRTEDVEYDNQDAVQEVIDTYNNKGKQAAKQLAKEYKKNNPNWSSGDVQAIDYAASDGDFLSPDSMFTYYMKIAANSESAIEVSDSSGTYIKLSDIMGNSAEDGLHYVTPSDTKSLGFLKVSPTLYQVENCNNKNDLYQRIKGIQQESYSAAYCKQDSELMVSTRWLKDSGFIVVNPTVSGDLLMLSTTFSNIYLDKAQHSIVVGSTVYSVAGLDESEIWKTMGDGDIYINFRAVLGWTGDYMIFKNVGDTISVAVTGVTQSATNTINGTSAGNYAIPIYMGDTGDNKYQMPVSSGTKVEIQGTKDTRASDSKNIIPMWSMYPLCNYFVYMNQHYVDYDKDATYHDWLFVFKPKEVQVNGTLMQYDDTAARQLLHQVLNVDVKQLDSAITVWVYPLYRDAGSHDRGMPKEMSYSDKRGYVYTPQTPNSLSDAVANYMKQDNVMLNEGSPEYTLPFVLGKDGKIRCINYSTFKYDNGTKFIDYGKMPAIYLLTPTIRQSVVGDYFEKVISHLLYSPLGEGSGGAPSYTNNKDADYTDSTVFPAITSPALWFLGLSKYSYQDVLAAMGKESQLYWGTIPVRLYKDKLYLGVTDVTDKLKDKDFLLMRETASDTSQVGRWFSVSQLVAFDLEGSTGSAEIIEVPKDGTLNTSVDVIDWDEYKLARILETGEFGIAILMIITLSIVPRIALALFLILVALGVIQNVKLVHIFCDKVLDPYKLLTCGRRDVHTFKPGRAFISSIIAMAVFALFMDGTIIHIYEWFMQIFAVLVGIH